MNRFCTTLLFLVITLTVGAQEYNQISEDGTITMADDNRTTMNRDTTKTLKQIPMGLKVWTVDARFGDRTPALPDTLHNMFMNTIFTTGLRGEFNTTGNPARPLRLHSALRLFCDNARQISLHQYSLAHHRFEL